MNLYTLVYNPKLMFNGKTTEDLYNDANQVLADMEDFKNLGCKADNQNGIISFEKEATDEADILKCKELGFRK